MAEGTFGSMTNGSDAFTFDFASDVYTDAPTPSGSAPTIDGGVTQDSGGSYRAFANSSGVKAQARQQGSWRLAWRWEPLIAGQDAGVPTDETFNVLVTGNTTASVINRNGTPGPSNYNSTGHAILGGQSDHSPSTYVDSYVGTSTEWETKVKRLISVRTYGLAEVKGSEIFFDVSATAPEGRTYDEGRGEVDVNGETSAYVDFSHQPDTRSVSISSPNIDSSYKRTTDASYSLSKYRDQVLPDSNPDGSTIGESAAGLLNEPNADGSMVADSVAVWDGPSNQWMAQGSYQANTPGFTNPTLSWTLSGGNPTGAAQDELSSSHRTIDLAPFSGPYYDLNGVMLGGTASGSGMMGQTTLTLKATDSDSVEGNNTYTVNWHLPYEKEVDRADGPQMKELFWLSEDFMNGNSELQTVTAPAKSFDVLAMIDDVLVLGDAVGVPTEPLSQIVSIYKALTNISKWTEEAPAIEVTATNHPNTRDAFSAAVSHWPEDIEGMDVATRNALMQSNNYYSFSDYDVYVGRVRYHHEESLLADKYDIHGFHSPNHVLKHDVTERIEFQNYYRIRGISPTTPPAKGDTEVPSSYNLS